MVTNNKTLKKLHDIQTQCFCSSPPLDSLPFRFGISVERNIHTLHTQLHHTQIRIHARIDDSRKHKRSRTRMHMHSHELRADTPSQSGLLDVGTILLDSTCVLINLFIWPLNI